MSASIGEHMRVLEGTMIQGRYRVVKEIGCGNFAKVYKVIDTRAPEGPSAAPLALKVLKREYATDASFELEILKAVKAKAQGKRVVQMVDNFNLNSYPCFVFKLAGPTLRSRKMGISRRAVTIGDVRRLSKDLIQTLAFLHHDLRLIHTDLKPENILLEESDPSPDGIGASFTIADFGSASFFRPERPDSDLISTRPYRAPEVVLGMTWSTKADVWSLACILFEVYYGGRLFEVHDDHEHLNKFEQRLGKIPLAFAKPSKLFRRFFDDAGNISRRPTQPVSRTMGEILQGEPEFFDMLRKMLALNPAERMSCADALNHPFITGGVVVASSSAAQPRRSLSTQDAAQQNNTNNLYNLQQQQQVPVLVDKENDAESSSSFIPGTNIPLPDGTKAGAVMMSKATAANKWQQGGYDRAPAGVPSARMMPTSSSNVVGGNNGITAANGVANNNAPSSRKLF